jgi:hypothetical protein
MIEIELGVPNQRFRVFYRSQCRPPIGRALVRSSKREYVDHE